MDKRILEHIGHVECLEVAWYGDNKSPDSMTVECTKCGVVVHDFELEMLAKEEMVRLRLIASVDSNETSTFALVELDQQLINELLGWKKRIEDINDVVGEVTRGSSINVSIIEGCPIVLKDYNSISGNQHTRFHEIADGETPDGDWWLAVWSSNASTAQKMQDWLDLVQMPSIPVATAYMFVSTLGFGWEIDAQGEKYFTVCIPWALLTDYA